uniref:Apple domain-containing protein n=1 Tax=Steinernema glaseri TaxID=37863 RepID=A0A1I8AL78_9BILA
MQLPTILLVLASSSLATVSATTEWFGDLRAHLNPPRAPAFYDVTYDDADCPQGLHSDAIPDYVYFGAMMSTMTVDDHSECLQQCVQLPKCKAVNFFEPMTYQEKGFCELLTESQFDNPSLMRPFRKATYYEKIRCRDSEDSSDAALKATVNRAPVTSTKEELSILKKLSDKVAEFNLKFRSR